MKKKEEPLEKEQLITTKALKYTTKKYGQKRKTNKEDKSSENASTTELPDIITEAEAATDEIAVTTQLPQDVDTEEVSTVSPEEEHLVTTKSLHVSTKKHGKKRKTSEEIKTTETSGENAG